jgi:hypothetical protein
MIPVGVASLPPHPAQRQRANHAEGISGENTNEPTNQHITKQTNGKLILQLKKTKNNTHAHI